MQALVRDLNHQYRDIRALHRLDCDGSGFRWIQVDRRDQSVVAFLRYDHTDDTPAQRFVVIVCNFTPAVHHDYTVGVPGAGKYVEILNTDASTYGGTNVGNLGGVDAEPETADGFDWSVRLTLPPLATIYLTPERQLHA